MIETGQISIFRAEDADLLYKSLAEQIAERSNESKYFFRPALILVPSHRLSHCIEMSLARINGIAANFAVSTVSSFIVSEVENSAHELSLLDESKLNEFFLQFLFGNADLSKLAPQTSRYIENSTDYFNETEKDTKRIQLAQNAARLFVGYLNHGIDPLKHFDTIPLSPWQRELWDVFTSERPKSFAGHFSLVEALEKLDCRDHFHPMFFGFSHFGHLERQTMAWLSKKNQISVFVPNLAIESPSRAAHIAKGWLKKSQHTELLLRERLEGCDAQLKQTELRDLEEPSPKIKVLNASIIRKEVEMVANAIWDRMAEDESLHFNQIALYIPQHQFRRYLPHLQSVFKSVGNIPYTLNGQRAAGASGIEDAFSLLLRLPETDFTRDDVLSILGHPIFEVRAKYGSSSSWADWIAALNVFHGEDHAAHSGTYITQDIFNWEQALTRLTLGSFLAPTLKGESIAFESGLHSYAPAYTSVGDRMAIAELSAFLRTIIDFSKSAKSGRRTLATWSEHILSLVLQLLPRELESPIEEVWWTKQTTLALQDLCDGSLANVEMSYPAARSLIEDALPSITARHGRFLADGVSVLALSPFFPMPMCQAFVLGLGENVFPARFQANPNDLVQTLKHDEECSPSEKDLLALLQIAKGASDCIHFSYLSKDLPTGDEVKLATSVETLVKAIGVEPEIISESPQALRHCSSSLRQQHLRDERSRIQTTLGFVPKLEDLREHAVTGLLRKLEVEKSTTPKPQEDGKRTFSSTIYKMRDFLECPLQAYAKQRLRIEKDESTEESDVEPLCIGMMDGTSVLRSALLQLLANPKLGPEVCLDDALKTPGLEGRLPVGVLLPQARQELLSCLESRVKKLEALQLTKSKWMFPCFGRGAFRTHMTQLPPIRFQESADVFVLSGTGELIFVYGTDASVVVFCGGWPNFKYLTRAHLSMIAMQTLAGDIAKSISLDKIKTWNLVVLSDSNNPNVKDVRETIPSVGVEKSTEYLGSLMREINTGCHDYFLPIEAVEKALTEVKFRPVAESLERDLLNWRNFPNGDFVPWSTKYGPVPADMCVKYGVPHNAETLIKSRFRFVASCVKAKESRYGKVGS